MHLFSLDSFGPDNENYDYESVINRFILLNVAVLKVTIRINRIFFSFLNYVVQFNFLNKDEWCGYSGIIGLNNRVAANKDLVLGMLEIAHMRFNINDLECNVVRGVAYLKASGSIAKEVQNVTTLSEEELMQIKHIGETITNSIITRIQNNA